MFGTLNPSGGFFLWLILSLLTWGIPIVLVVWVIRTLNGMLATQREMVEQLRLVAQQGTASSDRKVP